MTSHAPPSSAASPAATVRVAVVVRLKREILDPQGRAVRRALRDLGFDSVEDVRVGKLLELELAAGPRSPSELRAELEAMAVQLLANPVLEDFELLLPGETTSSGCPGETSSSRCPGETSSSR
jgi:phosphoribosylformylglycinamidine synthase